MSKNTDALILIMFILYSSATIATEATGTKGQNFDRIVFETPTDADVKLTARVMTINRFHDSASQITVVNDGAEVLRLEKNSAERWTKTILINGAGRHEVMLLCQTINSDPVYCGLTLDDSQARIIE